MRCLGALMLAALVVGGGACRAQSARPAVLVPAGPNPAKAAAMATDWTVVRVGGDMEATATFDTARRAWRAGESEIDTALPVGYPPPTPPGAIELKRYPSVRRAEMRGAGRDGNGGFWPLFNHIKRSNIAMTSPVEFDYAKSDSGTVATNQWTMSFLYRTPELRETGVDEADPRITIRDTAPLTVVSLGGRGSYDGSRVEADIKTLQEWLALNPEWEAVGAPRALMYNGPSLRPWRKWLEVQIPVAPAGSVMAPRASSPTPGGDR